MQQGILPLITYPFNGTTILSATNANPVVFTVAVAPLSGSTVLIQGFTGGWTGANTLTIATQLSPTTFSIAVNSSGFGAVTGTPIVFYYLQFQRPPRQVPAYSMEVTRIDNTAWSGVRETIFGRSDQYLPFDMQYVAIGNDVQSWAAFVMSGIQGVPFNYYPDHTVNSYTTYTMEDTNWLPAYKSVGQFDFKIRFRVRIAWP